MALVVVLLFQEENVSSFQFFHVVFKTVTTARTRIAADLRMNSNSNNNDIAVIVNGMPGLMALETAISCLDNGLNLLPFGFTGPNTDGTQIEVKGESRSLKVDLLKGPGIDGRNRAVETLKSLKQKYPRLVAIDYTHPSAVLNNLNCYVEANVDFVMGTTGGDPDTVRAAFARGSNTAVIAPNMAKQIVAVQAALLDMSRRYPNSFKGYQLTVTESHQSTKADTSGTAKALVTHMSTLIGAPFGFDEIVMLRDRESQVYLCILLCDLWCIISLLLSLFM